jgi:hypothetical protein
LEEGNSLQRRSTSNKTVGKNSDLEGLGDVITKVKKEDVQVPAGAIRKHKMVKQLSGRLFVGEGKSDVMEIHKKRIAEAKKQLEEDENEGGAKLSYGGVALKSRKIKGARKEKMKKAFDILALIDDAIEKDPTEEAKEKAAARKAAANAPILPKPEVVESSEEPGEAAKSSTPEPSDTKPEDEESEPPKDEVKDENEGKSAPLVPPTFASASNLSSSTPAYKKVSKQAKTLAEPKATPEEASAQKEHDYVSISSVASDDSPLVPASSETGNKTLKPPASLTSFGKKDAGGADSDNDSDASNEAPPSYPPSAICKELTRNDVVKERAPTTPSMDGSKEPTSSSAHADTLRKKISEVRGKLDSSVIDAKIGRENLKKENAAEKKKLTIECNKEIQAYRKVNEKTDKQNQKAVDGEKKIVENLRAENKGLRATQEKLPKQMAEVMASSQSLEKANEVIAAHFEELNAFTNKLQTDHDRLVESNRQCKDEYLPRYRQELWERQLFLKTETNIRNLYRNCMVKIAKKIEKSKQADLIEEISSVVLETEGEINPKFDPKLLFGDDSDKDSDSSSMVSSDSDSDSD